MGFRADRDWLPLSHCAKLLGVDRRAAARILEAAPVRRQNIPGFPPRWHREDMTSFVNSLIEKPAAALAG